jgi:hypothetical protein
MTDKERFDLREPLRDKHRTASLELARCRQELQRHGAVLRDLGHRLLTADPDLLPDLITPADTENLPVAETLDHLLADIRRFTEVAETLDHLLADIRRFTETIDQLRHDLHWHPTLPDRPA